MRLPYPDRSRAVLIGASRFDHADLCDLPAVRNNLTALAAILTDPHGTGLPVAHCQVLSDTSQVASIGGALEDAADAAEDALIVYYAGHGLIEPVSGELYLTLPGTNPDRPRWTAVPMSHIRQTLINARAGNRVLLMDCCFSGRAIQAMADSHSVISGQIDIAGTYTLTASPANTPADAPVGDTYTAFSGELISWLRTGDAAAPRLLTLGDTYLCLLRRLTSQGRPQPQQHGTRTASWLALAPNPAFSSRGGTLAQQNGKVTALGESIGTENGSAVNLATPQQQRDRLNEAESWYRRAVEQGTAGAMIGIADLPAKSEWHKEDEERYLRAVADGDPWAMIALGDHAEDEERYDEAESWYLQATDAGSTPAMWFLGALAKKRHKLEDAEAYFRRVAETGDPQAMNDLAEVCVMLAAVWEKREGPQSTERRRYLTAAEAWLRKVAEDGDDPDLYVLGLVQMWNGQFQEAESCFRVGIKSGDHNAMRGLGELLTMHGQLTEAESWYRKAAEQGNSEAIEALARFYTEHPQLR